MHHIDMKLVEFNFKLIYNIIPCYKYLSKFTALTKEYQLCKQTEDTLHMLVDCISLNTFWKNISNFFGLNINKSTILCGSKTLTSNENVVLEYVTYFVFSVQISKKTMT